MAGKDDGARGTEQIFEGFGDEGLKVCRGRGWLGGEAGEIGGIDLCGLDVEGNLDPDRTGAAGGGKINGALKVEPDRVGIHHGGGILGDGTDDGGDIHLLDAHLADAGLADKIGPLDLAAEEEAWGGIEPRAGDTGDGIGAAGAGGKKGDADAAGGLGVIFGGDGGGLLVEGADGGQIGCARAEGVIEVHGAAAGQEEEMLHTEVDDELDDVVGEFHGRKAGVICRG
jgi:hypothetical protein